MSQRKLIIVTVALGIATGVVIILYLDASRWTFSTIETSELVEGAEYRHLSFSKHRESFEVFCVTFDPRAVRASIVDLGVDPTKSLRDLSNKQHAIVAINGGYFDTNRQPIGLLRIEGQTISPLVQRAPLSGCVIIDNAGQFSVTTATDPAASGANFAIQAGPFLIDPGGVIGIHSDTSASAERTICAISGSKACLICTTPVSMLNLSRCLHDHPEAFGLATIDRALNLDGGPSTGFAIQTSDRSLIREPRGKIRDALVIQAKD